jgi:hypothetical protein
MEEGTVGSYRVGEEERQDARLPVRVQLIKNLCAKYCPS